MSECSERSNQHGKSPGFFTMLASVLLFFLVAVLEKMFSNRCQGSSP